MQKPAALPHISPPQKKKNLAFASANFYYSADFMLVSPQNLLC